MEKEPPLVVHEEEGILFFSYRKDLDLDLETAKETVRIRAEFTKGKDYVGCGDLSNIRSVTREARAWLALPEPTKGCIAAAIIMNSPVSTALANFFVRFNKPPVPTKFFKKKEDAVVWLKECLKNINT